MPVADYLILLLLKESSWSGLPYVLQLYDVKIFSEKIRESVQRAAYGRNMYATLSKEQAQNISDILELKRGSIPEKLYKEILLDLKYVTKRVVSIIQVYIFSAGKFVNTHRKKGK